MGSAAASIVAVKAVFEKIANNAMNKSSLKLRLWAGPTGAVVTSIESTKIGDPFQLMSALEMRQGRGSKSENLGNE